MLKLISIFRSGPGDWIRLVQAYLWLFRAKRLMKRARGNQWLINERQSQTAPGTGSDATDEDWNRIKKRVAAVSRASRYPVSWAFCLQRSFALREWLAKDGILTEVKYGVRKRDGSFDAHAWVVYDEKIINDSVMHISTFAVLKTLDDYGQGSTEEVRDALLTSKSVGVTDSENATRPA